jgi:hypothetical protein
MPSAVATVFGAAQHHGATEHQLRPHEGKNGHRGVVVFFRSLSRCPLVVGTFSYYVPLSLLCSDKK